MHHPPLSYITILSSDLLGSLQLECYFCICSTYLRNFIHCHGFLLNLEESVWWLYYTLLRLWCQSFYRMSWQHLLDYLDSLQQVFTSIRDFWSSSNGKVVSWHKELYSAGLQQHQLILIFKQHHLLFLLRRKFYGITLFN